MPLCIETGFYPSQPQCGNMIRTALQLGFVVFGYDTIKGLDGKTREIMQAMNIKNIFNTDPHAKILIHCGYDHINESEHASSGKKMAGFLKEFTGIDPFTIDQVELTERSSQIYEPPIYQTLKLNTYSIFTDSLGNLYSNSTNSTRYDCCVYHPRTIWIDGRPNWVFENGRIPVFVNDKITIGFPCLVFAYNLNDNDFKRSVPIDLIELKSFSDTVALSLKRENYLIYIRDITGKTQSFYMFRMLWFNRFFRL